MNKEFFETQKAKWDAENSKWTAIRNFLLVMSSIIGILTALFYNVLSKYL
jgi:hypothetical protein